MNNHCSKFPHCHCITTNQVLTCEFYVQPMESTVHEPVDFMPCKHYSNQGPHCDTKLTQCHKCQIIHISEPASLPVVSNIVGKTVCAKCGTLPCEHFQVLTPAQEQSMYLGGMLKKIGCGGPHILEENGYLETKAKVDAIIVHEEFGPEQVQYEHSYRVINWLKEAQALGLKYSVTFVDDDNSRTVSVKLNDARLERMINDASIKRIYIELEPKMDLVLITKHEQPTKDTSASN